MTNTTIVPFDLAGDVSERLDNPRLPLVAREFHQVTVYHETFEQGLDALRVTHAMSGLEGSGMIVEGEPGLGKTTLLNKYVVDVYQDLAAQPDDEVISLPVLKVRVPGRPTIPRVIEKLLMASNHIKPAARKTETLEMRLHKLIRHQNVEMLILDEYHHLVRGEKYTHDTLNFLKVFADDYKLAIVFSGLPWGREALDGHEELSERMGFEQVLFRPFDMSTKSRYMDFANYVKGLDHKLAELGVDCCPLCDNDMLPRLLLATQGKPRFISRLIFRLLMHLGDRKPITMNEFEKVFSKKTPFASHLDKFNPFNKNTPLDKVLDRQKKLEEKRKSEK